MEDNLDDVSLTVRALKNNLVKNEIIVSRDGVEALDFLFRTGNHVGQLTPLPELILLDLRLPKLDGLEILRRIRAHERTRSLPVIIMTSSDDEQDRIKGHGLGIVRFVRKPVDFEQS